MRHLSNVVLMSAFLTSTGCGTPVTSNPSVTTTSDGRTSEGPPGSAAAQQGNALVRFVNADLNTMGADVVSADRELFRSVAAKGVTGYLEIPRGRRQFKLREAGGGDDLATVGNRELVPGRHYTLVALPREKGGTRLAILGDWLGLIEPGQTRVRLINATADVDDLDLFLTGTTNHVLHGVDIGRTTTSSFADMDAGMVEIRTPSEPAPTLLAKLNVEPNRCTRSSWLVVRAPWI
jgi:hypothetical protein